MKRTILVALCCVGAGLFLLGGCRDNGVLQHSSSHSRVTSVRATPPGECYAQSLPYPLVRAIRVLDEDADQILAASLLVERLADNEFGEESLRSPGIVKSVTAGPLAAEAMVREGDPLEPAEVLLASAPVPVLPKADIVPVASRQTITRQAVLDAPIRRSEIPLSGARTRLQTPLITDPEVEADGALLRPGQLTPTPLAEVILSYAEPKPARIAKPRVVNTTQDELGWVKTKWVESKFAGVWRDGLAY